MSKQLLHSPIILCFLLTSLPFLVISQSPSSELKILLNIKEQWGNPRVLQSWNATTSHCQWPGIKCASDRTVTGVSLGNQNITGEFPPSICDLNNLTTLDLGCNYLGGQFPTVLYKCTNLQNLNLTQNLFVGQLPNDISNLSSSLQHLDLSYNNFTGDIPSSIGQLKRLITLHLEWNLFNGAFPSEMGDLENLEELVLAYNSFSPMELPTEFGELKSIRFLWMTQCNLIGKIPESLGNLYSLEHLDLANNNLEGGIPSGLFLLENLRLLYLYNNTLTGKFPTSIEARNLVEIDVSNNTITGTIPQGIGNLPRLEILNLFGNQFYGILPPSIGLLPMLKTIKLWNNKFSGPLPAELGRHSRLKHFEVSDNQFTGHLPEDLCSGGALLGVVAFNNQLNGSIPKSLGQCNSLRTVQLNDNYFSGEIPEGLWSLQDMSVLKLSNNQLFGRLPNELAQKLTWIEISNNRFFGEIPWNATFWDQLVTFEASNNRISGSIPLELTSLSKLNSLSLDGNHLSGELPSKILSWVNLNRLNLSRNELSGSIPSALGLLPVLNSLDLSINHFSGQIPPELGLLKLSLFNVSSNKLTGRIPYGYDNAAYHTSFLNTSLCSVSGLLDLPRCKSLRENAQNFPPMYLALIVVLGFMGIAYFSWFIFFKILKGKHAYDMSSKLTPFQRIDFTEQKILANITENNLIGSGGSGKVYKIPVNESGNVVAAKRIWNKKTRNEKEFLAEVETLSTIRHVNIIKLLCCISREDSKILVYEYMENHSLDKWIHERKRKDASWMDGSVPPKVLDWPKRLRIAVGVAKGLRYMHHDCSRTIIHRDVKSSNVLLDSEFNAKIADFGLARILDKPTGEPDTMSAFAGSFGYMAPEYGYSTKLNEKIDIYSFGVVLLELVTGKEPHKGDDEYSNLAQWAWRHYSQGHPIADALDEQVKDDRCLEEMIFVFMLGLKCTSTCPCCRPSMKEVLQLLRRCNSLEGPEGAIDLNESDSVSALLGNGRHFSSCRSSKKEIKEDDHIIVTIL